MTQLTIHLNFGANNAPIVLSPLTDYYVLLHDFETVLWNQKPRSLFDSQDGLLDKIGYPEMVPLYYRIGTKLTEALQWFWFDLCMLSCFGHTNWRLLPAIQKKELANAWSVLTDSKRAFTNHAGTDYNANYIKHEILGEPLRSGLPKQFEVLCGGNVVKVISHVPVRFGDEEYLPIEVWNGRNPAPNAVSFNWGTHPHLIHWATIATPFPAASGGGAYRVEPFPQLAKFPGSRGVPYAVLSSSPQYVPLNRVRRLRESELFPSPYVS